MTEVQRIKERGEPKFEVTEDGSLSNVKAERYALFLADDVAPAPAWKLLGGQASGGSHQYRRRIESYPPFIDRLAWLRREKDELMADDLFGETKWMVGQMWREARATGNSSLMQKAAEMRMKILEKEEARRGGEPAPGRPGRPVVENPQTTTGMDGIKQRLLQAGAPVPGQDPGLTRREVIAMPRVERLPQAEAPQADFDAQLQRMLPG